MHRRLSPFLVAVFTLASCASEQTPSGPVYQDPERNDAQLVLLKADDVDCCPLDGDWRRFVDLVRTKELRAGLGIIANSLEKENATYLAFLRDLVADRRFELWNHGYDHECRSDANYWEFRNSGYDHQKSHMRRAQELARERLGITMRAFGAPCNAIDDATLKVVDEDLDVRLWIYGNESSRKLVILRTAEAEFPTHNPDADQFIASYDPAKRYLTLQVHPAGWDDAKFMEFETIVDFLIGKHVRFVTPSELGQALGQ